MNVPLDIPCRMCKTVHRIEVPIEDLRKWDGGLLIQKAFPYLSVETRELMISGTCSDCFDKLFKEK